MKFAKIDEEVFSRYGELTGEEFRLYCTVFFHTFIDTGICRRNLRQLCLIHGLNYTHTTERYKKLEKLKWCETTKKGIRPLVGLNVPKNGTRESEMFRKTEHQYSENGNTDVPKNGTFGDEMFRKTEHTYKEYTEPLKSRDFSDNNNIGFFDVVTSSSSSKILSEFSREECLRWVEIRIKNGEEIETPHRLARWAHRTGEADAFIQATLYPETIQIEVENGSSSSGTDDLQDAISLLLDLRAEGENLDDFEKYYPPEVWARLMEELKAE